MSLLFDFADEVLSRPRIDFTAAAGTIIDLTYSERLKNDGSSDVHHRFFVDMAERYIARAGRQRIHTFHPRGLRYLELLVTGDLRQFELHDIALTRADYPVEKIGAFECSDPLLNEIWELGRRTQFACMEDAYLDCPWRERGLYSGDFLVQFYVNLAAFGDTRLFPRCIELFLLAQGENGLVPGGAHGLPPGRHPDYSAIIPQAIWHYWARTADTDFLRGMFPRLHKLMTGLAAFQQSPGELLDATGLDAYIDLCHMDKSGVNCALNCFHQSGFAYAARVADLLGERETAREWDARARQLADAIRAAFWDETQGVFLDRRRADVADTQPSVPANALPILYDIATPQQSRRAVQWLSRAMLNNFRVPEPHANTDCNVTPYFSFYALGALYKLGLAAEAQQFIRANWSRMLDHGAWTAWEYFVDSDSRCHAWSASPTHYLSTEVLGVQFPEPGNANHVQIRPQAGTLQWATGVYPHPAGPIHVRWEIRAGRPAVDCSAPPGVRVDLPET